VYVLDTNAIIYYADDEPTAVVSLEPLFAANHPIYISTLTELELFPLMSQIARVAGDLRRAYAGLKAFDSGIAATALLTHFHLITRNVRDFQDIDGLSLMAL
jgi:predicted nucleic acid-binding protein